MHYLFSSNVKYTIWLYNPIIIKGSFLLCIIYIYIYIYIYNVTKHKNPIFKLHLIKRARVYIRTIRIISKNIFATASKNLKFSRHMTCWAQENTQNNICIRHTPDRSYNTCGASAQKYYTLVLARTRCTPYGPTYYYYYYYCHVRFRTLYRYGTRRLEYGRKLKLVRFKRVSK
jgi:hypothetical protein